MHPYVSIQLLPTSGNKTEPVGEVTFETKLGTLKVIDTFIICKHLKCWLILGQEFHHIFRIDTDWHKYGRFILYKNGKLFICAGYLNSISNIQSIKYQEISSYATTIIQIESGNSALLEKENNDVIKVYSASIDSNPNLKCYPHL